MLKLTQKTYTDKSTDKRIAFVECEIVNEKYSYRVSFDKDTKRRANVWFRTLGFRVGALPVGEVIPDKVVEI